MPGEQRAYGPSTFHVFPQEPLLDSGSFRFKTVVTVPGTSAFWQAQLFQWHHIPAPHRAGPCSQPRERSEVGRCGSHPHSRANSLGTVGLPGFQALVASSLAACAIPGNWAQHLVTRVFASDRGTPKHCLSQPGTCTLVDTAFSIVTVPPRSIFVIEARSVPKSKSSQVVVPINVAAIASATVCPGTDIALPGVSRSRRRRRQPTPRKGAVVQVCSVQDAQQVGCCRLVLSPTLSLLPRHRCRRWCPSRPVRRPPTRLPFPAPSPRQSCRQRMLLARQSPSRSPSPSSAVPAEAMVAVSLARLPAVLRNTRLAYRPPARARPAMATVSASARRGPRSSPRSPG